MLLLGHRLRILQEVLDAQRKGRLVVFAGAGVSKEQPAGLPLFCELVERIAGRDLEDSERRRPDRVLGKLADEAKIPVHEFAKKILGRDTSTPASGHRSLVDLFPDLANLRIVTTNADRHFTTILRERDPDGQVDTYYAPALPLGNDFTGLVYLHGSVDKNAERMVLTDKDFGRAYLTDAYAARFLERMFAEFTVLFVGYSHRDFMMEFLGRGLNRSQGRYVLTAEEDERDAPFWESFGIKPCFYEKQDGENAHIELWNGLAQWATYSQEPPSARERRFREITASLPSFVSPTDLSYLEWQLRDILGARLFGRHASDPAWLLWLEGQPGFQRLFAAEGDVESTGYEIAEWFCQHFVLGDGGAIGLAVVERHSPHIHPALWHRIVRTLASVEEREPHDVVGKWIGLLLSSWHPSFNCDLLSHLLRECQLPEELDTVVALFDLLTRPLVGLERGFNLEPGRPAATVKPRSVLRSIGDPFQLLEFVEKKLRGNEEAFFEDLLAIAEHHLLIGHRLLLNAGDASKVLDEASFRRAAIEPHEQNQSPKVADILIDATRVLLEWAADEKPYLLNGYVDRWIERPAPLLRRLAVYAAARRTDKSADERLQWLVEHDLLFSLSEKHEVFGLLEGAFGEASPDLQQNILDAAMTGESNTPSLPERTPSDYERYNVLVWLKRCTPGLRSVSDALAEASRLHPEYVPRSHPDLGHEIKVGFVPGPEEDEVVHVLAMQPPELLTWLESCRDEPPEKDACYTRQRVVQAAIAKSFEWGLHLATELAQRGDADLDLWVHVIDGFKLAPKTLEDWRQLLALFAGNGEIRQKHSLHIAWLLWDGLTSSEGTIPLILYPRLLDLVMSVWREHPYRAPDDWMDWAEAAINTSGGVVAEILVEQISQLRRQADRWDGLPVLYCEALEELLGSREDAAPYARVILSGGLHVLYDCDPEWTLKHVIPLLDWSKSEEHALQSWHGFLVWSRPPEECLAALLPHYAKAPGYFKEANDQLQSQLARHIASILTFSSADPYADNWMVRILSESSSDFRLDLARSIQWLLGQVEDVHRREELWETRLKPYWKKRLDGPLPRLVNDEQAAMVEWILPLASCLPSVASLVEASEPTASLDQAFFWHLAKEAEWITRYPTEAAELCTHLTRGFPDAVEPYRIHDLGKVIKILEGARADAGALRALREEALRLGINPRIILRFTEEYLEKLGLTERQRRAVEYVRAKEKITNREYVDLTGVSRPTATRDLTELVKKGILKQHGHGKGSYFEMVLEK